MAEMMSFEMNDRKSKWNRFASWVRARLYIMLMNAHYICNRFNVINWVILLLFPCCCARFGVCKWIASLVLENLIYCVVNMHANFIFYFLACMSHVFVWLNHLYMFLFRLFLPRGFSFVYARTLQKLSWSEIYKACYNPKSKNVIMWFNFFTSQQKLDWDWRGIIFFFDKGLLAMGNVSVIL